jgi:hypothetical protein
MGSYCAGSPSIRGGQAMEKLTTALSAHDRVILFCVANATDHGAVGITAHAMQSMVIRGFFAHDRESGAYTLMDSGRATLAAILEMPGLAGNKKPLRAQLSNVALRGENRLELIRLSPCVNSAGGFRERSQSTCSKPHPS